MKKFLGSFSSYLSFVKFSHTVFAMPFAFIGFTLAVTLPGNPFSIRLLLLIILCMIFARNAAMGFNRLADRKFDALNPRTASREIPAGVISGKAATLFVIANSVLFIAAAAMINTLTLILSPVALIIILGYSLTKRFTVLCHFILGLGLSLAPIGAYISVTNNFAILPVVYSFIVLTWVSGFDIIYSLQDDGFDKDQKLFSIPSSTGRRKALVISAVIHCITFILVLTAGLLGKAGFLFWSGAGVFSILLCYQHAIVKPDDISRVNMAFATTNGLASIAFSIFVILDRVLLLK
ncbi:MAG: UbiA-like polyprenyltransferase [Bacteroidales bacterium]